MVKTFPLFPCIEATNGGFQFIYIRVQKYRLQTNGTLCYSHIEKASTITSILVLAIGTFLSWLGSLQLYAFGQLVEDNQKMQKTIDKLSDTIKLIAFKSKNEK